MLSRPCRSNGCSVQWRGEEAEADRLEAEISEVCGVVNAAVGRLVELIARVLANDSWHGVGIHSAEQWV